MKLPSLKIIANSSLALVLASSLTFHPVAFANGTDSEPAALETIDLQDLQDELQTVQAETPSVIPGDFFYFAKIAFEKIRLALTFDDTKEAELMASYASERLAEAAVLYGNNEEEKALEVIQTAIQYMESSQELIDPAADNETKIDQVVPNEEDAVTEETSTDEAVSEEAAPSEDVVVTDETTAGDESAITDNVSTDDESAVTGDTSTKDGEAVTDETPIDNENAVTDDNSEDKDSVTEIKCMLRNNIIALTAAMKHVGNENARAALQKNINKTYVKIAKKLERLEKKCGKMPQKTQEPKQPGQIQVPETTAPDGPATQSDSTTVTENTNIENPNHVSKSNKVIPVPTSVTATKHTKTSYQKESDNEQGKGKYHRVNENSKQETKHFKNQKGEKRFAHEKKNNGKGNGKGKWHR